MLYIRITSDVSYDAIYYTTDGTNPTRESNKYEKPFPVYNNCEIRAIAVKDEWIDSDITSLWVDVSSATPELVRKDGTASDNCYIEIYNKSDYEGVENLKFYYTLDGSQPNYLSEFITLDGAVNVRENCTVKMISGGEDNTPSPGTVELTIEDLKCQTPVIDQYYDTVSKTVRVILTSPTEGASLYYTLDGSVPGNESYLYAGEFGIDHNCTVRVVADTDTLLISDIAEAQIVSVLPTPSLYFDVSKRTVTVSNLGDYDLETTFFFYTTNGIEPSDSSTLYNVDTGIQASGGSVVKLVAIGIGGVQSTVATFEVPYVYHTVMFNSDGGTDIPYQSIREGDKAISPEIPEKAGFIFQYWYKDLEDTPSVDEGTLSIVGKAQVGKAILGKTE